MISCRSGQQRETWDRFNVNGSESNRRSSVRNRSTTRMLRSFGHFCTYRISKASSRSVTNVQYAPRGYAERNKGSPLQCIHQSIKFGSFESTNYHVLHIRTELQNADIRLRPFWPLVIGDGFHAQLQSFYQCGQPGVCGQRSIQVHCNLKPFPQSSARCTSRATLMRLPRIFTLSCGKFKGSSTSNSYGLIEMLCA